MTDSNQNDQFAYLGNSPFERLVNLLILLSKKFLVYYQVVIVVGGALLIGVGAILYFITNILFHPF